MKKRLLSLALALCLSLGLAAPALALAYGEEYIGYDASTGQLYRDVPTTHWAAQSIATCSQRTWFNGYPDGTFRPDGLITREEAAKVFAVAMGLEVEKNPTATFTDTKGTWASAYIEAAKPLFPNVANLQGTASFRPTQTITREEAIYALVVAWGYGSKATNADLSILNMFSDTNSISAGVKPYMAVAVAEGLVAGLPDGTIAAQKGLTRAEFATLLARALSHGYGPDSIVAPAIDQDETTQAPEPTPSQKPEPSPSQDPEPSKTPEPSQSPKPAPSQDPEPAPSQDPKPSPSQEPEQKEDAAPEQWIDPDRTAVKSGQCGADLYWILYDNGEMVISGNGLMENYSPLGYAGQAPWSNCRDQIHSVTIESGVTSVGDSVFDHCEKLTKVTLPSSIKSIGSNAFSSSGLTSIDIPTRVTSIGDYAFSSSNLTFIDLPDNVTNIGTGAFWYSRLARITLPAGLESISNSMFGGCTNLTWIAIPESATAIGDRAFYHCPSLADVYYAGDAQSWAYISIANDNDDLTDATFHFNSTGK